MSIKAAQLHAGTKAACEEASQGTTTIRIVAGPPDKHRGTLGDKKKTIQQGPSDCVKHLHSAGLAELAAAGSQGCPHEGWWHRAWRLAA